MVLSLLLLAESAMAAPPPVYDFRNWHVAEAMIGGERTCTFSLSSNFYGITVRYLPASAAFEVMFESPGVQVLPTDIAIPLKIDVNGTVGRTQGKRVDRRLIFQVDRTLIETGMRHRGQMRIVLSDPSIKDTLIARYRMQGKGYEASFTRFLQCRTGLTTQAMRGSTAQAAGG